MNGIYTEETPSGVYILLLFTSVWRKGWWLNVKVVSTNESSNILETLCTSPSLDASFCRSSLKCGWKTLQTHFFYYFLIFFNYFEIFLSGVAAVGKPEIELRIYDKNFSRNGQPSEQLCPFYRRYLKLCSWEAHQMAVALYEQLFRDETKFSRAKSVADDY